MTPSLPMTLWGLGVIMGLGAICSVQAPWLAAVLGSACLMLLGAAAGIVADRVWRSL